MNLLGFGCVFTLIATAFFYYKKHESATSWLFVTGFLWFIYAVLLENSMKQ